jgi:hypothetical protein
MPGGERQRAPDQLDREACHKRRVSETYAVFTEDLEAGRCR